MNLFENVSYPFSRYNIIRESKALHRLILNRKPRLSLTQAIVSRLRFFKAEIGTFPYEVIIIEAEKISRPPEVQADHHSRSVPTLEFGKR